MTIAIETGRVGRAARPIASYRHTAVLAAIMLAMAGMGAFFQHSAVSHGDVTLPRPTNLLGVYLPLLAMEWGLVLFVARGLRSHGVSLRDLIGGRWSSVQSVVTDIALALGIWSVWTGVSWISIGCWGPVTPLPSARCFRMGRSRSHCGSRCR